VIRADFRLLALIIERAGKLLAPVPQAPPLQYEPAPLTAAEAHPASPPSQPTLHEPVPQYQTTPTAAPPTQPQPLAEPAAQPAPKSSPAAPPTRKRDPKSNEKEYTQLSLFD
jgi:hypothetical protein